MNTAPLSLEITCMQMCFGMSKIIPESIQHVKTREDELRAEPVP